MNLDVAKARLDSELCAAMQTVKRGARLFN